MGRTQGHKALLPGGADRIEREQQRLDYSCLFPFRFAAARLAWLKLSYKIRSGD